jgi:hypothetical protein
MNPLILFTRNTLARQLASEAEQYKTLSPVEQSRWNLPLMDGITFAVASRDATPG